MIAAGVNANALSTYLGHANIAITMDRHGHLMPGNEAEAAGLLDAFLSAASFGEGRLSRGLSRGTVSPNDEGSVADVLHLDIAPVVDDGAAHQEPLVQPP